MRTQPRQPKSGVYAGSFDPLTVGHLWRRAWVPEETFAAKRAEVLEDFLARARIYTTDLFFGKYEQRARANLLGSLRSLKSEK